MKYAVITALAFAAGVMADGRWGNGKNDTVYTTEIVTHLTTYCPSATTLTVNGKTHTITEATTLTITDCPCTITKPKTTTRIPTTTGFDTTIYHTTCTAGPASSSGAPPQPPPTTSITPATTCTPVSTSRGITETPHGGEVTTAPTGTGTGTGSGTATPLIPTNSQYTGAANINRKVGDGLTGVILAGLALVL